MATYDIYPRAQSTDQGSSTLGIPSAGGLGAPFQVVVPFTAATTGSADDVTVYAATVPFKAVLTEVVVYTSTAVMSSTMTLYSATGGGGTALSSAISTGSTGVARTAITTGAPTVAAGSSIYARRSDRAAAGTLVLTLVPSQ